MDILMIIHRPYPPSPRLRREAKTLTEAGHDVRVLHPASESGTEVADGIKVRRYTETSNITKKLSSNLLKIDLDLKREIEKEADIGFDVVHVHDFPPAPTVLHAVDCPVILDMHDNYPELVREWELEPTWSIWGRVWGRVIRKFPRDPKRAIYNTFRLPYRYKRDVRNLRKAAERSDTVLAVVPEAKEAYMEMGVEEEKITVISNTVDLDWFEKYSVEDPSLETDEILITFTGKVGSELRGLDTIIEALPMIRAEVPEVKVRFAGKSYFGTKNNLEDLAESLGVEEHVEFTGWIDPEEFPKYMKAADIGLVPYRSIPVTNTTVPNKLFQYMAAELPVLVTDTDAVGRIVRETNSGVVVPAEDPDAFAEGAIELADPDRRAELGRNGRKAVEEEYNWERDAERLLKVYESL